MKSIKIIDDPFASMEERISTLKKYFKSSWKLPQIDRAFCKTDLHLHTNYSDGYWTSTGLVLEAFRKGMNLIALTDHDCFHGIEEAFEALKIINEFSDVKIEFVPGIEFSTNYYYGSNSQKKKEVHILGYFPANSFTKFQKYLDRINHRSKAYFAAFQHNRILRIYEMVEKFNRDLSCKVKDLEVLRKLQNPIISDKTVFRGMRNSMAPGRLLTSTGIFELHYLNSKGRIGEIKDESFSEEYLKALGILCKKIHSAQDFMKEFFDKKEPSAKTGYIGFTESPEWAVKTILDMRGIPVLAHPAKYNDLTESLLSLLVPLGLKGVEVISDHFKERIPLRQTLEFVNNKYPELIITVGSDCHGISVDREIDYTPKNVMGLSTDFQVDLSNSLEKLRNYNPN